MDQRVNLIKELVDNVKEKQSIDKQFTSFKVQGTRKNSKRSSILANDQQANNVDPLKVTRQIARNKEIYHGKLQQFDQYLLNREKEQREENEKVKDEIKNMIQINSDQDSVVNAAESLDSSRNERNAWFHKYSKSNLPQRKKRILNIHLENQKMVRRLLDIKPHPDFIQLKQSTLPLELPPNKIQVTNNTQANGNGQSNINTQRDFVKENKLVSPFDELDRLQNQTMHIQKEKSCLSFINDSLDVIDEVKNKKRTSMVSTGRIFNKRNDKNLSQLGLYTFEQSSRPTTSTSRSQATIKRPQTQTKNFNNGLKSLDLSKLMMVNANQTQGANTNPWLANEQHQQQEANIKTIQDDQSEQNFSQPHFGIQSEINSTMQRAIPQTARMTIKEEGNLTLQQFAQRKSYTKLQKLLDSKNIKVPKDVSAMTFIQKEKFVNSKVKLDPESYQLSRTSKLQKRIDDYLNEEKAGMIKTRQKWVKQ